jgi:1-acyl-sn-glycerol-3-phosphate acyltransferase
VLRSSWTFLVVATLTVLFGIPAIVATLARPRSNATMRLARGWSRSILAALGIRVVYDGLDRTRTAGPCVYVANHQSWIDIWVLMRVIPASTRLVAKEELRRVPVIGQVLSVSGFVMIDRSNRARSIQSLRQAAEKIRGGRSVLLFPEGTRSRDGRLQPFKKGGFHLALQAGVPVVPVAIHGSFALLPPGSLRSRRGTVRVEFLDPVSPAAFRADDPSALRDAVRVVMARRIEPPEAA